MEARKLKLLIGFLGLILTSNAFAATLTDIISTSRNNHIVHDENLKDHQDYYRSWNKDSDLTQDLRDEAFKTANLNISSFAFDYTIDNIHVGLKLQKDITMKSKYWVFILAKSSLSIGNDTLPASILTAMAFPNQDVVRLCTRGLNISTLSGYQKTISKRFLRRHSRFLCR